MATTGMTNTRDDGLGILLDIPKMVIGQRAAQKETESLLKFQQGARLVEEQIAVKEHARGLQADMIRHEIFKRKVKLIGSILIPMGLLIGGIVVLRAGKD